jgi:hypothetical protein
MSLARFGAIVGVLLVAACAGPAGNVSVMQSDRIQLVPGATVAWSPLAANALGNNDPRIDNDILRQRIRSSTEAAFAARGFRVAEDAASAQYLLSYHLGLREGTDYRVETMGRPGPVACGWRGCVSGFAWGMYGAPTNVRALNYNEATLIIDVVDRPSGELAWRATSQQRVDQSDASQQRLNAILADMTRSLPSAPAG